MSSSFDDAVRCPQCDQPGDPRYRKPAPRGTCIPGSTLIQVFCMNERCQWYETSWIVQVNPDGTIPDPKDHTGETTIYNTFAGQARRAEQILQQMLQPPKS